MSGAEAVSRDEWDRLVERMVARCNEERDRLGQLSLPVELDLSSAVSIVENLQFALRHTMNKGGSAAIVRGFIERIIARLREAGYQTTADVLTMGDRAEFDRG